MTANVILLDQLLAQYGRETRASREMLQRVVVNIIDRVWHGSSVHLAAPFEAGSEAEAFNLQIQQVSPQIEAHRSLHAARIIQIATDIWRTRLLLFTERGGAIPMHFLVVLVFWLTIIFMSFTLSAQPSPMVIGEMIVFALPADWHAFQLRHRWSEPVSPSPGFRLRLATQ